VYSYSEKKKIRAGFDMSGRTIPLSVLLPVSEELEYFSSLHPGSRNFLFNRLEEILSPRDKGDRSMKLATHLHLVLKAIILYLSIYLPNLFLLSVRTFCFNIISEPSSGGNHVKTQPE
jgi:hypothetical protein